MLQVGANDVMPRQFHEIHGFHASGVSPSLQLVLGTAVDGLPGQPASVILSGNEVALHKHVMGVTGSGKSKALVGLAAQLLNQGVGVAVIDPHGDLCDDLLGLLLDSGFYSDERAYQRLWYVPFNDSSRYLSFNVLQQPYEPHAVARHLLEAWKRAWPALAGGNAPNLEQIVLASSLTLIQNQLPITLMERLLTDAPLREHLLDQVRDAEVVAFFRTRYNGFGRRAGLLTESASRRAFLMSFSPALRYCLGQAENRLNLRALMDAGVSLLFDLSGLDEDTQRFLGCLITVGFEVAALARADQPAVTRRPYHLMIDEFAQFSATSETALERVLALTRKYGLTLTLAHQTWSQVRKQVAGALQNALLIAFRLGPDDAAWAATRLGVFDPYRVKRMTGRGEPVYLSLTEQRFQLQQEAQALPVSEAFVRLGDVTRRLRALQAPPSRASREQLLRVKERYAQLLLTPEPDVLRQERDYVARSSRYTANGGTGGNAGNAGAGEAVESKAAGESGGNAGEAIDARPQPPRILRRHVPLGTEDSLWGA